MKKLKSYSQNYYFTNKNLLVEKNQPITNFNSMSKQMKSTISQLTTMSKD